MWFSILWPCKISPESSHQKTYIQIGRQSQLAIFRSTDRTKKIQPVHLHSNIESRWTNRKLHPHLTRLITILSTQHIPRSAVIMSNGCSVSWSLISGGVARQQSVDIKITHIQNLGGETAYVTRPHQTELKGNSARSSSFAHRKIRYEPRPHHVRN